MKRAWVHLLSKIATDIVIVAIAFVSAFLLQFRTLLLFPSVIVYYKVLFFIAFLWLVIFNLAGLYKPQTDKINRVDNLISVSFGALSASFFTYVFIVFLYKEVSYSKEVVTIGSIIALVLVNISRYLIWKAYQRSL